MASIRFGKEMKEAAACSDLYSTAVLAIAAIVQAATAIIIVCLTRRLATATTDYAKSTKDLLELSRAQDSRALLPNWHISFAPFAEGAARLTIFNLSRNSARITHLFIRVQSENEPEARRFPLDLGMPSGYEKTTGDIAPHILEATQQYALHGAWNGILEIGVVFQLAESPEPRPSVGFSFRAVVQDGRFIEASPRLPYIAGDLGQGAQQ